MPAQALPKSPDAQDRALASLAKALGHPTRGSIIRQPGHVDACVREPVDLLPLSQSTVSQDLKVLREAGLIRGTIEGLKVCYCLEPSALRAERPHRGALWMGTFERYLSL